MRGYIISFLVAFTMHPLYGQPRVDGQQQFKVLKSSPIVTNIVGWAYDTSKNKWAGYYNTIDPVYKGNNKVPIKTTSKNMSTCRNIVSLQTKKLIYKDSTYYAIVEVYWHSGFDYPSIYEGFYFYKNRAIYIFDSKEYAKLQNLDNQVSTLNEYYIFAHTPASNSLNDQLQEMFNGKELERTSHPYKAYFKKESDNTIRFTNDYKNSSLSDEYFEIKQKDWNSLLIE